MKFPTSTRRLDCDEVLARLTEHHVEAVYRAIGVERFGPGGPGNWLVSRPWQATSESRPSVTIRKIDGVWSDKARDEAGSIFHAVVRVQGCEFPEALAFVADIAGIQSQPKTNGHKPPRRIRYAIRDADGPHLATHVRIENPDGSKKFVWERPDGKSGLGGIPLESLPLYRIDELGDRPAVVVCEGEKATDALAGLGVQTVGTVCGAGSVPGDEALMPLTGKTIYLWPDNDVDGRNHMHKIAARLASMGCQRLYMVKWDDAPPKGDAADYVARGATKADVWALLKASPVWNPGAEPEPGKAEPEKPASPVLRVVRMQDVIAKPVDWLWERWLAHGKVTIIGGHAGDGKSTLTAWLAATLSNGGKWPDGTRAPKGRTLFLLAEDGLEDTLRPRLDQHGADVSQVFAIQAVQEPRGHDSAFSIARHLDLLEEHIIEEGIDLLVIDPITSFMPKSDRNAEGDVRDLLTPLTALAVRTDVAVTPVMHVGRPTGTNRRPVQQLLGATAFGAIARTVWMVAPTSNEPDEARRVLAVVKSNLATKPPTLEWSRELDQAIKWHGESEHDISELLGGATTARPRDNAEGFLRELLADGPVPVKDVEARAKEQGISITGALRRAREAIGVKFGKSTIPNGPWLYYLPGDESKLSTRSGTAQLQEDESKSKLSTPIGAQLLNFDTSGTANDPTSQIASSDVKLSSTDESAQVRTSKLSSAENKGVLNFESAGTSITCRVCGEHMPSPESQRLGICGRCRKEAGNATR